MNNKIIRGLLAVLIGYLLGAFIGAISAQAARFNALEDDGLLILQIVGEIELGDDDHLEYMLEDGTVDVILLNSKGGNLMAGLNMAQTVREYGLSTLVLRDCHSACTNIFFAGAAKMVTKSARIGVHNPYDPATDKDDAVGSAMYFEVLGDFVASFQGLKIAKEMIIKVYTTPSEDMYRLTRFDYKRFGIEVL